MIVPFIGLGSAGAPHVACCPPPRNMCSEIPLIDLRLYAGDLKALGAALHEAATSVGFLYLVNTELDRKASLH